MKPNEIYAAAWRKMAEIISEVDMDDYEDNPEVIEAIDSLTDTFEKQAQQLEADQELIEGLHVHANLTEPEKHDIKKDNTICEHGEHMDDYCLPCGRTHND